MVDLLLLPFHLAAALLTFAGRIILLPVRLVFNLALGFRGNLVFTGAWTPFDQLQAVDRRKFPRNASKGIIAGWPGIII
jgi:hypothetical protein